MYNNISNSLINELFNMTIDELKKEENKKKIQSYILEPTYNYISNKIYPYIIVTFIILILFSMITIIILYMLMSRKY